MVIPGLPQQPQTRRKSLTPGWTQEAGCFPEDWAPARFPHLSRRGDFDQQTAEIHATVAHGNPASSLKKPVLRVTVKTSDGQPAGEGVQNVVFDPRK